MRATVVQRLTCRSSTPLQLSVPRGRNVRECVMLRHESPCWKNVPSPDRPEGSAMRQCLLRLCEMPSCTPAAAVCWCSRGDALDSQSPETSFAHEVSSYLKEHNVGGPRVVPRRHRVADAECNSSDSCNDGKDTLRGSTAGTELTSSQFEFVVTLLNVSGSGSCTAATRSIC